MVVKVEKGVYSPWQPRTGTGALGTRTNKHKCREAQAPETPVDICRQENDEVNNDTDNEAGEDIILLETEMDLSDGQCLESVQETDLSRLASGRNCWNTNIICAVAF